MQSKEKVTRRTVLGATAALGVLGYSGASATPRRKPNFVFILADDLGAFDLSCYGRPDYRTPRIDSLARDGMKFNFGYANSSTCAPTRTALFSGRYQNRLAIGSGMGGGYPSDKIGYSADLPSLANTLQRAGYRTGLVGKWDLGELPTFGPNACGYDEFFGVMSGGMDYYEHDMRVLLPVPKPQLYENDKPIEVAGYATDLFSDRACDFIARNKAQPFLLSLHYTAPHSPWQTRTERNRPAQNDFHFDGGSLKIYAEMMKALDDGVGRVLDTLERQGLTRDTIVIFTSDNGGERFSYMWPLRGEKADLWEGGTRVPLIAKWPGHIARGTTTDQVALSMDFLPTFAAIAGAALDPKLPPDGIDLSPQLFGAAPKPRTVFWKTPGDMQSMLSYPWKYVALGKREYLYNLAEDVREQANLKLKQPERFASMKRETEAWSAQMLPPLPGPPIENLMQTLEALDPVPIPKR